jgi:hypothetical protein
MRIRKVEEYEGKGNLVCFDCESAEEWLLLEEMIGREDGEYSPRGGCIGHSHNVVFFPEERKEEVPREVRKHGKVVKKKRCVWVKRKDES